MTRPSVTRATRMTMIAAIVARQGHEVEERDEDSERHGVGHARREQDRGRDQPGDDADQHVPGDVPATVR